MKKSVIFIVIVTLISIVTTGIYFLINEDNPTFASFCLSIGTGLFCSGVISIFIEINNIVSENNKVNEYIRELTMKMYHKVSEEYQKLFEYLNYNDLLEKKFSNLLRIDNRENLHYVVNKILTSENKTKINNGINLVLTEIIKCNEDWKQIKYFYSKTKNYQSVQLQKEIIYFSGVNLDLITDCEYFLKIKEILTLFENIFKYLTVINPEIKNSVKNIEINILEYHGGTSE